MSPENQRIAIAEICGWHGPFHEKTQSLMTNWWSRDKGIWWLHPDGTSLVMASSVPDYVNDLNAMHAAEDAAIKLSNAGGQPFSVLGYHDRLIARHGTAGAILSSAAQRAEAFLRTLGWEDGE